MVGFEEGYTYFAKNASAYAAATMSDSYVASVNDEINKLVQDLNSLEGFKTASKAVVAFCVDSGFTMFGLVEQDYTLPKEIIEQMGIETFEYESFQYDTFEPEGFSFDMGHEYRSGQ